MKEDASFKPRTRRPVAKVIAISIAIGVLLMMVIGATVAPWAGGLGFLSVLSLSAGWSALMKDRNYYPGPPPGDDAYPTDHYGGD